MRVRVTQHTTQSDSEAYHITHGISGDHGAG